MDISLQDLASQFKTEEDKSEMAQSIQAQTISNLYLALENDLEIIPVLNKVDLPSANPEEVTDDIVDLLGCKAEEVIHASAKTGLGIENILEAIVERVPEPKGNPDAPLQALIFDSVYNPFRGVETYYIPVEIPNHRCMKLKIQR